MVTILSAIVTGFVSVSASGLPGTGGGGPAQCSRHCQL